MPHANRRSWPGAILLSLALLPSAPAPGADQSAPAAEAPPAEKPVNPTWAAAQQAMIRGPGAVPLRDQGVLQLPDGFGFVPTKEATAVMKLMGNTVDKRFIGLVFPLSDDDYFVSIDYEDSGYIKDDEAKEWDAAELLQSLKDGTEAANEERKRLGIPAIKVTRWIEPPSYDSASHQLVWSAEAKLKEGTDDDPTINYNTYVLGREGYFSANLITSASQVDTARQATGPLLRAVAFDAGKRYSDFDSSTDHVAAYGLTALVGGLAAKKLGLLAVGAAFLAKFAKLAIAAVAVFGAGIARFFKGRSGRPGAGT